MAANRRRSILWISSCQKTKMEIIEGHPYCMKRQRKKAATQLQQQLIKQESSLRVKCQTTKLAACRLAKTQNLHLNPNSRHAMVKLLSTTKTTSKLVLMKFSQAQTSQ